MAWSKTSLDFILCLKMLRLLLILDSQFNFSQYFIPRTIMFDSPNFVLVRGISIWHVLDERNCLVHCFSITRSHREDGPVSCSNLYISIQVAFALAKPSQSILHSVCKSRGLYVRYIYHRLSEQLLMPCFDWFVASLQIQWSMHHICDCNIESAGVSG